MTQTTLAVLVAFLSVLMGVFSLQANALPKIDCRAWTHNQQTKEFADAPLKQADYDPGYYEAKLGQYTFSADYTYLQEEGVGLIVYDTKSRRFMSVTSGFKRLGNSKNYDATARYYDINPKGETVVAGVTCGYLAP